MSQKEAGMPLGVVPLGQALGKQHSLSRNSWSPCKVLLPPEVMTCRLWAHHSQASLGEDDMELAGGWQTLG